MYNLEFEPFVPLSKDFMKGKLQVFEIYKNAKESDTKTIEFENSLLRPTCWIVLIFKLRLIFEYGKMAASARKFRTCFKLKRDKINWYPGHMNFSFKHMQSKMRKVDCVVEVHDSRIPFSGRNPKLFHSLVGPKPHILVLNKTDLIDSMNHKAIMVKCKEENITNVLFTNCLSQRCEGLKKIIPLATELIQDNLLISEQKSSYTMMVVGVPNVGKSSVINALRNINLGRGKATSVGALPGITKSVQNEIKVSTDPVIYLIDTPGILTPSIANVECGMKLALCSCIKDSIVGIENVADFLLYWMNKTENFTYVKQFGLNQPVDEIFPLLVKIAVDNNLMRKVKNIVKNSIQVIPNTELAAEVMIRSFRKGELETSALFSPN